MIQMFAGYSGMMCPNITRKEDYMTFGTTFTDGYEVKLYVSFCDEMTDFTG